MRTRDIRKGREKTVGIFHWRTKRGKQIYMWTKNEFLELSSLFPLFKGRQA
jgi:hypothetical protein